MVHGSSITKRKTRTFPTQIATGLRDKSYKGNGDLDQDNAVADITWSSGSEEITYGTKPKSLRSRANHCTHIKTGFVLLGGVRQHGGVATVYNPDGSFLFESPDGYPITSSSTALTNLTNAMDPNGYAVLGVDGQGYINDAFAKLKPDLTQISLPNFLLELDEVPRLFQIWKKDLAILKNAAGARLNWSYGWAPLVGDLSAMRNIILGVYQKCVEWNKNAGSIFHRSMVFPTLGDTASGNFVWPSGSHRTHWSGYFTGTVTAHLTFKTLKIPELQTMEGVLRVYLDALGFELNPRIIWDAIPFSFVLDWFFDVGGWCNRFKRDTLELPIVLIDSYLQYKEERRCESYWLRADDGLYVPRIRSGTLSQTQHLFQRRPIFPDLSAATAAGWKVPGLNQLINAFSLAVALKK